MNLFLSFRKDLAFNLMKRFYYFGTLGLLFPAFCLGKYFYILVPLRRHVPTGISGEVTFKSEPNVILGIIIGIWFFIFLTLVWKTICQLLLILFQSYETYISKYNKDKELY